MELNWILTCITAKGLMNRAHAYKAAVQTNTENGQEDPDHKKAWKWAYTATLSL